MKHLNISDYGTFLGLRQQRLLVRNQEEERCYPLNRLCSITITKRGVSISSDLIEMLSLRGIKLFFVDFRGVAHAALLGEAQHGVVGVRTAQFNFMQKKDLESEQGHKTAGRRLALAKLLLDGKVRNQRAVLLHLNKYHKSEELMQAAESLLSYIQGIKEAEQVESLLGLEGISANRYFQALQGAQLFSSSFIKREKRGTREISNSMLNFGYAILSNYVLSAIVNAGLEPYLGILHHANRPGRMSLVYDLMEEYRAWVVDRTVIKLRQQSEGQMQISAKLKKNLIQGIQLCLAKKYLYHGKKLKMEHIIQRQVYRLCGHFYGERKYKPYFFKW